MAKRRAAGKDLGGRRQTFTDSQIRNALRLIEAGDRPPRSPVTSVFQPITSFAGVSNRKNKSEQGVQCSLDAVRPH